MDYKSMAAEILKNVGGEKNVSHFEHCSTRLRFSLADPAKANLEALKKINGVMGVVMKGQCQVIIGNNVIEVYEEVMKLGTFSGKEKTVNVKAKQKPVDVFIDFMVGIFQPLIAVITGGGIVKAILTVATYCFGMSKDSSTYLVLYQIGDACFYFLPIMVAFTCAAKLKCNQMLAVIVAAVPLLPSMTKLIDNGMTLFGATIPNVGYSSQIFPAILSVFVMAFIEKYFTKICPKVLRVILVPAACFLITIPLELLILGPLGYNLGTGFTNILLTLNDSVGWVVVAILAAALPFMTITGMHKALIPYVASVYTNPGYDMLNTPAKVAHNLSECGACFAVAIKTKKTTQKTVAFSASLSALFGISEPALYGVTMLNKRAMTGVVISSFISALVMGIAGVKSYASMSTSIVGLPRHLDANNPMNFVWAVIGYLLALGISFIVTLIIYKDSDEMTSATESADNRIETKTEDVDASMNFYSPLKGRAIPMSEVNDEVFSAGILGKGIGIIPEEGKLYAPCDGKIFSVFPTKHAISMIADNGAEVLLHVGLETVTLNGKCFSPKVKDGDIVKAGDLIMEFNIDEIKRNNLDLTTCCVITNSDHYEIDVKVKGNVNKNTLLMSINNR